MTAREQLLADIRANPNDDAPRLVYADWLSEQGDPRGEFIQLQCRAETENHPRVQELLAAHKSAWSPAEYCDHIEWRRGFMTKIMVNSNRLTEFLWRWKPDEGPEAIITCLGDPIVFDAARTRVAMLADVSEIYAFESGEGGGYGSTSLRVVDVLQVGPVVRQLARREIQTEVKAIAFSSDGTHVILTHRNGITEEMELPAPPEPPAAP